MEADSFDYPEICERYGVVGFKVPSFHAPLAPAIACFVRGTKEHGVGIELIRHLDMKTGNEKYWLMHACTFRLHFGTNLGTGIDRATGTKVDKDISNADPDTRLGPSSYAIHSTFRHPNDKAFNVCCCADEEPYVPMKYEAGNETNVKRLRMSEIRVIGFHVESSSWQKKTYQGLNAITKTLFFAIVDHVDFICGDVNQYANRFHINKKDTALDHTRSCIIDRLERILSHINSNREAVDRATYKVVNSTQQKEWLKGLFSLPSNSGCFICIALSYGTVSTTLHQRANDNYAGESRYVGRNNTAEYHIAPVERCKYLLPMDLGLNVTDEGAHSPLMLHIRHEALKNFRHRTLDKEIQRRQKKRPNRYQPLQNTDEEIEDGEQ